MGSSSPGLRLGFSHFEVLERLGEGFAHRVQVSGVVDNVNRLDVVVVSRGRKDADGLIELR